jgi:DNA polymerase V
MQITLYKVADYQPLPRPLFLTPIWAGFPSPAQDFIERELDLNELVIKHPAATFFLRVEGDSMVGAGIHSGDILIADRAIKPRHGHVVVAVIDGEFTVKRLYQKNGEIRLLAENPNYLPLRVSGEMSFEVWGVVTHNLHKLTRGINLWQNRLPLWT